MFFDIFAQQCRQKGVTLNKACVDCGISRTSVAKWKKGATPNGATLAKLAAYFGVTTDCLLGAGTEKNAPPEECVTLDDFTYAMQNEYKDLTEMDKQILLSMAKQLNDARKQQNGKNRGSE